MPQYAISTLIIALLHTSGLVAEMRPFKVLLDPGHGGHDSGTVHQDLREKIITLKIAKEVKSILEADSIPFDVKLTREKDVFVHLDKRKDMANTQKPDLFVSIHVNSNSNPKVRGTEFYFENQIASDDESLNLAHRENSQSTLENEVQNRMPAQQEDLGFIISDLAHSDHMVKSQLLSQTLLDSFKAKFTARTKTIRQAPFRVLLVQAPATLVELGYISSPEEAKWISSPATQRTLATAIADGVKSFKEKLDKIKAQP